MMREPPGSGSDGGVDWPCFPDLIETGDDSPVLLSPLLLAGFTDKGRDTGLRIISIDGIGVDLAAPTDLPGIRVGSGAGCGYVIRRALDSHLVFVPDAGYQGLVTFTYTIADDLGEEATIVATVSVHRSAEQMSEVTFADGSQSVCVAEGVGSTILGALDVDHLTSGTDANIQVFERGEECPSTRFVVSNGKLVLLEPLAVAIDGETTALTIVASVGSTRLAEGEFTVTLRPANGAFSVAGGSREAAGESSDVRANLFDQFLFKEGTTDASDTAEAPLVNVDATRIEATNANGGHGEECASPSAPLVQDGSTDQPASTAGDDFVGF